MCRAQGGQSRSGRSSLCGSGRVINLPSGSLFGGTFWEKLRPSLKKASSEFWPTFNLVLVSHQMAFVEALSTYLLSGEIKMVKLTPSEPHIFFFLWQTHRDNRTRSSHRGKRREVQGVRTQVQGDKHRADNHSAFTGNKGYGGKPKPQKGAFPSSAAKPDVIAATRHSRKSNLF